MIFKVLSNPNQSMILWFHGSGSGCIIPNSLHEHGREGTGQYVSPGDGGSMLLLLSSSRSSVCKGISLGARVDLCLSNT